jgi:bifunctional non-homologous end joining protein LigD
MPKRPTAKKSVPREISFSNPQKVYFPGTGMTKGEVIKYYIDVARWMVPHLEQRPVTLIRFPNGVGGKSFYEKNAPSHTPDWVPRYQVPRRRNEGVIDYILINDADTLAWCANLGAIELHPFLHRVPDLDRPTHVAFDLDPGEGANLLTCIEVAQHLRALFQQLGLKAWPKVSGSKGLQIYVPLNTPVTYEGTQPFAKAVAELMEQRFPKLVVSNMTKALRKQRVLIDWSQNTASKTTVSVYALRAKREEPFVSMPVEWKELEQAAKAQDLEALFFTPSEALARLKRRGDLFAPVLTLQQRLPKGFGGTPTPSSPKASRPRTRAALTTYAAKRDFTRTAEPPPKPSTRRRPGKSLRFVIQKHAASHLHYDFRLEWEGTLKSWAVPKGLPYALEVKRSAFETEDHPLEYLEFEGTIPAGQYGGGTVMVWDIGTYETIDGRPEEGRLRVRLSGEKLQGEWLLYRIRRDAGGKATWLMEKRGQPQPAVSAQEDDRSVLTGRSMAKIAHDNDAQWQSHRSSETLKPSTKSARARGRRADSKAATEKLRFVKPMAAQPVTHLPEGDEWVYEVKWDGFRALALKEGAQVRVLSRNNRSLAEDFPAVVAAVSGVPAESALIDGEIVALDADGRPSFQSLQHRKSGPPATIVYYAFDLLQHEGEDLKPRPLAERKTQLARLLEGTAVRLSADLPGTAAEVIEAVRSLGLEGVVAKRRDAAYEPGERSPVWKKLRLAQAQEFVIGGYKPGLRHFESVLVGTYEQGKLIYAGKVRAGFNPRSRAAVAEAFARDAVDRCPFANLPESRSGRWGEGITAKEMAELKWLRPRQVIQVEFVEWTRQGHLRHATFKGLRPDKRARDVVREPAAA